MSHGQEVYSKDDIQKIVEAGQFSLPKYTHVAFYILIVLGVLSFLSEFMASREGQTHAWMALHVNFMYWFGAAAASAGFAAVFKICNAQWARPLKRIFESSILFLAVSPLFIIVMYFGAGSIYEWAVHPIPGKAMWLSPLFLYTRDFVAVCLLIWVLGLVIKNSISMDLTAMKRGLVSIGKESPNYSRWLSKCSPNCIDETGTPEEAITKIFNRNGTLSPVCVIVFALSMSLLAFDILMSVDPHWYSTMFGGFYFMSAVYLAVAFAAIGVCIAISQNELFQGAVKKSTLHDLGKLLLGFGIFWAYLFWSHYLPIWYGNLPEETAYMILRLREYPWRTVAWTVFGMCFVVPFILGLSRDVKQIPVLLALTGLIVAVGLWIQYYLLFAPTIYPNHISINLNDVGVGLGFLGLYGLLSVKYLTSVPLIPFGDLFRIKEVQ